jgi:hypothetical protein
VAERATQRFDPYAVLKALDRHRVRYVVIGAFARVIHGTEELTHGIDIVPSTRPENLRRLEEALRDLEAEREDGRELWLDDSALREPVTALRTVAGELKIIREPEGTRGYDDLRRAARREPLGQGVRPSVASPGDLARMLAALGQEEDRTRLYMIRRVIEFERARTRGIER